MVFSAGGGDESVGSVDDVDFGSLCNTSPHGRPCPPATPEISHLQQKQTAPGPITSQIIFQKNYF